MNNLADDRLFFEFLILKGLKRIGREHDEKYLARLKHEFDRMVGKKYINYFLCNWDFVGSAKEKDIIVGPCRGCFLPGNKVSLQKQFKAIQNVKVGDKVLTHDRTYQKVTKKFEYDVEEEVCKILLSNGKEISCTKDHLIMTKYGFVPARKLKKDTVLLGALRNLRHKKINVKCATCGKDKKIAKCFKQGWFNSIRQGKRIFYQSSYELKLLNILETRADVVSFDRCKFAIPRPNGTNYHPDFIAEYSNGDVYVYESKSEFIAKKCSGKIAIDKSIGESYCKKLGWNYKMLFLKDIENMNDLFHIDIKVEKIHFEKYKGKVYDLKVENVMNYTLSDVTVHNSAGASLVAYCLEITDIDPIEHNLLFTRFLSPIRKDAPDIDLDFQDDRRQEVYGYLMEKYGVEHCAKVATYSHFHPKGVLLDVGRIFDIPRAEISRISSLVIERCLSKNSKISVRRKSDGKNIQINIKDLFGKEELYEIKVAEILSKTDAEIKRGACEKKIGKVFSETAFKVKKTNKKKKFKIILENGKAIECSKEHRFWTRSGWKKLKELSEDDEILCRTQNTSNNKGNKKNRNKRNKMKFIKVKKIIDTKKEEQMYDIKVNNKNHNFFANNFLTHNSGGDARASLGLTDTFAEFKEAKEFKEKYPLASEIAMRLEGTIRHKGSHAAAMVVSDKKICDYAPVNKIGGIICIEWRKELVEDMKLVKFDILGLKTLTILKEACKTAGVELPKTFDDLKVYESVFKNGNTNGIFQFTSPGMQKLIRELDIKTFNGLTDATTLYRPGSLHCLDRETLIDTQTRRKRICDLKEDDRVKCYIEDGKKSRTEFKTPIRFGKTGNKEVFEIEAEDREIIATAGHRFLSRNGYKMVKHLECGDEILMAINDIEIKFSKIKSIKKIGIRETWDIEMPEPNNYVANKFVVHNSGQTMSYANRKKGDEEVTYMHPMLEPITKDTFGCILYQEQIMHIMHKVGAMNWSTAETARKAITKSKGKDAFEKMRKEFVDNAVKINGFERVEAEKLYDTVSMFGSYSFNRTHASGYSIISYYCAWFKHYYPQHFYNALLKYESDATKIKNFINDAEKNNISIRNPDINISHKSYCIDNEKIYAGLNSINGLGLRTAEKIIKNRPYVSFSDFNKRAKVSFKIAKALIISDAFRSFNINKKHTIFCLENKKEITDNKNKKLFEEIEAEECPDFLDKELAQLIYEYTDLVPKINLGESFDFGPFKFIDITKLAAKDKQMVFLRGIITDVLKKDKILRIDERHEHQFEKRLLYLNLSDDTGNIACQINPETFEKYKLTLEGIKKKPVVIFGRAVSGGNKIMTDMLEVVDGELESHELRNIYKNHRSLKGNESYIVSAKPAVSKAGNSYYRIVLSNKIEGLCFKFKQKLFPGQKVEFSIKQEPFINLKII